MRGRRSPYNYGPPHRLFREPSNMDSKGRLKEGDTVKADDLTGLHYPLREMVLVDGTMQWAREADSPSPPGWPYPYTNEH